MKDDNPLTASSVLGHAYKFLKKQPISVIQILILVKLGEGAVGIEELCKEFKVGRQTMGHHHISRLVKRGLVAKMAPPGEEDQRYKRLHLTTKGKGVVAQFEEAVQKGVSSK